MRRALFVTWDGPRQRYLETLFLPIYGRLRERGFELHVLQFRFGDPAGVRSARLAAEALSIPYRAEVIRRRPKLLGTAATLAFGARRVTRYCRRHAIDVVMPRSTLAAAMTLMARRGSTRLLFDADGFAQDERVEFEGWPSTGLLYRAFRDAEGQALRRSDAVITRTNRAKDILVARAGAGFDPNKIFVVPNGKDESVFRPVDSTERAEVRAELGADPGAPLVIYVGSLGPHYFPDEMFTFFRRVRESRPDARFLCLTGHQEIAHRALEKSGVDAKHVTIERAAPRRVARLVGASDVGLALRAPTFSQRGVSPIKVGEYLLSGTPVIAIKGVGDLDQQLGPETGLLLDEPNDDALTRAASWFVGDVLRSGAAYRERCRSVGLEVFGLGACVDGYARALAAALA